jgi:hypothetical protein
MPDRQFRLCRMNQRHAVANEAFQQRIYGNAAPSCFGGKVRLNLT